VTRPFRCIPVSTLLLAAACGSVQTPVSAPAAGNAGVLVLERFIHLHNDEIVRTFVLRDGAPRTVSVANRLTGGSDLVLRDAAEFVLTLEGGARLTDADCTAVGWSREVPSQGPAILRSFYRHDKTGMRVEVTYALSIRGGIRKSMTIAAEGPPVLIDRIELERFRPVVPATAHAGLGQPVYCGDLFWGCEYPAADNNVRDGIVSLGYLSGRRLSGGSMTCRTSIVGAGLHRQVRVSFLNYLDGLRASRFRDFIFTSSRFDLDPYDEDQATKAIAGFSAKMVREYGTPYQAYLLDAGWDSPEAPWVLDAVRFPGGWEPLRRAAGSSGAALGLSLPVARTGERGGGVVAPGCCLADATTRARLLDRAAAILGGGGVSCLRLDGWTAPCSVESHGHRAGPYAGVAAVDAALETIAALRRMHAGVFLLLGDGFWPSPWWLKDADAIWRGGDDYGFARVPRDAPRRERWITYVDSILHDTLCSRAAQVPLPALAIAPVVHGRLGNDLPTESGTVGDRDEPLERWERMVVMACVRGTHRADLHLSYAVTTRDQWAVLAKWLRWASEHARRLSSGEMAGGDPSKGEPYAFVHAGHDQALIVARNPSDREAILSLPVCLPPLRFRPDRTLSWRAIYPDARRGEVKPGSAWTECLPPFAVRVVELSMRE